MPKDQAYLEAEKKIAEALKSGATELVLGGDYKTPDEEKLSELPVSLWECKHLKSLTISYTKLTSLPDSLAQAQLTQLTSLNLSSNQLTTLPDSLGQLTQLTVLDLSRNQLTALPPSLGQLTQLKRLKFQHNELTTLPEFVSKLTRLTDLWIHQNKIATLPDSLSSIQSLECIFLGSKSLIDLPVVIRQFHNLSYLSVQNASLTDLPYWLAQLEHLETLLLNNNPLNPALQSAYDACNKHGSKHEDYDPLWAYLRSLEQNAEPLYEAKLVLVGEGNVGKTTLLKALKGKAGEPPQKNEATTHGVEIDIHGLRLPHPQKDGVEIQLNAWDFGGQDVYRVTHQFFFSRRSLYILVWEPRNNVQHKEEWMNGLI